MSSPTTRVEPPVLAVIGGSGFYEMPGLSDVRETNLDTPFGPPSDAIVTGLLAGARVAFLARHGRGHRLLPSEIPQRANFWALKSLGVTQVLAVSAVGSLREDLRPSDLVVPDQLIDRTRGVRAATFFGEGVVAHAGFSAPYCARLGSLAAAAAMAAGARVHTGGTYVVIEGPAFGTRAESHLYRSWGASVVGMTALPEAKLAREAELCYTALAAVTDYDSWHESEAAVTADTVFAVLRANVEVSQEAVRRLAGALLAASPPAVPRGAATPQPSPPDTPPGAAACSCATTLDAALVTEPAAIPPAARQRLAPILARRLAANP